MRRNLAVVHRLPVSASLMARTQRHGRLVCEQRAADCCCTAACLVRCRGHPEASSLLHGRLDILACWRSCAFSLNVYVHATTLRERRAGSRAPLWIEGCRPQQDARDPALHSARSPFSPKATVVAVGLHACKFYSVAVAGGWLSTGWASAWGASEQGSPSDLGQSLAVNRR